MWEPSPGSPKMHSLGSRTLSKMSLPVLEARHIILSSIGVWVKPGVPFSTSRAVNSGLPSFSPEMACTLVPKVIGVALLVMKILEPLSTQVSPSSLAVVLVPRESLPASSSVRPNPQSLSLHS